MSMRECSILWSRLRLHKNEKLHHNGNLKRRLKFLRVAQHRIWIEGEGKYLHYRVFKAGHPIRIWLTDRCIVDKAKRTK